MNRFKLAKVDRNNPLWVALRTEAEAELAKLRAQNDSLSKDAVETAFIRGKIACVKAFLYMERDEVIVPLEE